MSEIVSLVFTVNVAVEPRPFRVTPVVSFVSVHPEQASTTPTVSFVSSDADVTVTDCPSVNAFTYVAAAGVSSTVLVAPS